MPKLKMTAQANAKKAASATKHNTTNIAQLLALRERAKQTCYELQLPVSLATADLGFQAVTSMLDSPEKYVDMYFFKKAYAFSDVNSSSELLIYVFHFMLTIMLYCGIAYFIHNFTKLLARLFPRGLLIHPKELRNIFKPPLADAENINNLSIKSQQELNDLKAEFERCNQELIRSKKAPLKLFKNALFFSLLMALIVPSLQRMTVNERQSLPNPEASSIQFRELGEYFGTALRYLGYLPLFAYLTQYLYQKIVNWNITEKSKQHTQALNLICKSHDIRWQNVADNPESPNYWTMMTMAEHNDLRTSSDDFAEYITTLALVLREHGVDFMLRDAQRFYVPYASIKTLPFSEVNQQVEQRLAAEKHSAKCAAENLTTLERIITGWNTAFDEGHYIYYITLKNKIDSKLLQKITKESKFNLLHENLQQDANYCYTFIEDVLNPIKADVKKTEPAVYTSSPGYTAAVKSLKKSPPPPAASNIIAATPPLKIIVQFSPQYIFDLDSYRPDTSSVRPIRAPWLPDYTQFSVLDPIFSQAILPPNITLNQIHNCLITGQAYPERILRSKAGGVGIKLATIFYTDLHNNPQISHYEIKINDWRIYGRCFLKNGRHVLFIFDGWGKGH